MSAAARRPVAFDPALHLTDEFRSGEAALDVWLKRFAGQNQRRDAARTFVTTTDGRTVVGYYTLVAAELQHDRAVASVGHGLSKYFPIPAALPARLAVDREHHGRGLGGALLLDALDRVLVAGELVATRAVVVDASSPEAAEFYERHGFHALADDPLRLMVSLQEIRESLDSKR